MAAESPHLTPTSQVILTPDMIQSHTHETYTTLTYLRVIFFSCLQIKKINKKKSIQVKTLAFVSLVWCGLWSQSLFLYKNHDDANGQTLDDESGEWRTLKVSVSRCECHVWGDTTDGRHTELPRVVKGSVCVCVCVSV